MARIALDGRIRRVKLTFLDCDGVIFDTNPMKAAAFRAAVGEQPEDAVARLLVDDGVGGVSRYERLRWFFSEVVPTPADQLDDVVAAAIERFAAHSSAAYRELEPLEAALAFAESMGGADTVYVVTGTDQDEIRTAFEHHGIAAKFAEVLGSPTTKRAHIERVLGERGISAEEALFVGDGGGDFEVAQALGIPFVFLAAHTAWPAGRDIAKKGAASYVAKNWSSLTGWLRVAPALDTATKKRLRGLGHKLNPIVQTGQKGLTEAVLDQIDQALADHELVKIRLGKSHDGDRKAIGGSVARRLGATLLARIGHVALLYRPADEPERRRLVDGKK